MVVTCKCAAGNTEQADVMTSLKVERRTSNSHLKTEYTGNFSETVPALAVGATMTYTYSITFGGAAGTHYVRAFADSACAECDASRAAVALPIASLKLSVREVPAAAAPATRVATASVAGALAAADEAVIAEAAKTKAAAATVVMMRLASAERADPVAVTVDHPFLFFIRHAATVPGIGDPPGFRVDDCATQRNLSESGRAQSRAMGERLAAGGVRVVT